MPSESQAGQQAFGDIAPKLAQLSDNILFDDVWQRPELSPRERSLITVAALVALNRVEQLPFHLQLAQRNGVARQQLAELITHLAFYAGWPAGMGAAGILKEVRDAR
jgi:4-carboxymuconolactone decarboxylase